MTKINQKKTKNRLFRIIKNICNKVTICLSFNNKQTVFPDTSIIAKSNIIDMWEKSPNVKIVISSLVVEELEKHAIGNDSKLKYNAIKLLRISTRTQNEVILTPKEANLVGWEIENKDARIIRALLDYEEKGKVTVYTCDKRFALMTKSYKIKTIYFHQDNKYTEEFKETQHVNKITRHNQLLIKVKTNQKKTIPLQHENDTWFININKEIPYYMIDICSLAKGKLLKDKINVNKGDIIYKISKEGIEKFKIEILKERKNARLIQKAVFRNTINQIEDLDLVELIKELFDN